MAHEKRYSSTAEKQRAYRERQKANRNAGSVTVEALVASWRGEFPGATVAHLTALAQAHGLGAALAAADAVRATLAEERAWAAFRLLSGTREGAKLQRLVNQQDPRLVALLHEEGNQHATSR